MLGKKHFQRGIQEDIYKNISSRSKKITACMKKVYQTNFLDIYVILWMY